MGTGHCADPLMFRSHLLPSDRPDTDIAVEQKPLFKPCWKACWHETELKANAAAIKVQRARKIAVLADTTFMKDLKDSSGDSHSAQAIASRLGRIS